MVTGNEPIWLVVPERMPVEELSVMPLGSAPVTDHTMVPTPPACVNCSLKATPAVPVVFAGLVTVMVGQVIVSVYAAFVPVQPLSSVTVTLIGNEPPCVGVPERVPFAASVRPVGRVDAVVKTAVP